LPLDEPFDPAAHIVGRAAHHVVELTPAETQALLTEVPAAYQAQMNEVLLMGIAQVMARWTGARVLRVDVEGHGREMIAPDIDLSRTIGWFTALYPLLVELPASTDPGELLKAVKEQVRQVPQRGIGYGLLRHLANDAAVRRRLEAQPAAPLIVNYLGQFDQTLADSRLFRPARTGAGAARHPGDRRLYLLEVDAAVSGGRLVTTWTYSQGLHRTATIARLAAETQDALRALIEHCRAPDAGSFTPTDFKAARAKQSDLDKLTARIGRGDRRSTR
jgi:non-ribosomal peptide synthase protein (TIGR01720 family)